MKPVTNEMLSALIKKIQINRSPTDQETHVVNTLGIPGKPINGPLDSMMIALLGRIQSPAESPTEIAKLNSALSFLSSDTEYGDGKFYTKDGVGLPNYWLATIWAIASLNWPSGKEIARSWSKQSNRYKEDGFEKDWSSYNPSHEKSLGVGSLYKRAKELGWNQGSLPAQSNINNLNPTSQRFTLLGIDDLAALPPTKHLVKGILPSSGLAAIYGPSSSGKTFLALDLIMAIACQSDWFGHKVINAPVTYVGLEGKAGIKNRIQAWRIKNPTLTPSNFKVILDNFDLMKGANVVGLAQAIIAAQMQQGVIVIDTLNQASPAADENSSQDMGEIIKHLKLLQEMTDGLVLIVHHTGKNAAQGLRGHSSLKAALDANIEVIGGDKRSWLLEKSKDGEDGKSFGFRLEIQNLGIDVDSDNITSCTVERNHSILFSKPEPSGSKQKVAFKAIKQALATAIMKKITVEAAVSEIVNSFPAVVSNKRKNNARQILGSLIAAGYLSSELINDEGWIWLP
jgi:hypothetical protein